MWESGLTNFANGPSRTLATPALDFPGWIVSSNWDPHFVGPGALVALPGVVFPDIYYAIPQFGGRPFPYGFRVIPDR